MKRFASFALATLTLVGCGGADEKGASDAQFVKRADAACAEFDRVVAPLDAEANRIRREAQTQHLTGVQILRRIARNDRAYYVAAARVHQRLRAIPLPDDERARAYVDAVGEAVTLLRRLADASAGGDVQHYGPIRRAYDRAAARSGRAARGLGFHVCSR